MLLQENWFGGHFFLEQLQKMNSNVSVNTVPYLEESSLASSDFSKSLNKSKYQLARQIHFIVETCRCLL